MENMMFKRLFLPIAACVLLTCTAMPVYAAQAPVYSVASSDVAALTTGCAATTSYPGIFIVADTGTIYQCVGGLLTEVSLGNINDLPRATAQGTCNATTEGTIKRLSDGGVSFPHIVVCDDLDGTGTNYQWREYGADSAGYTPIDPLNWRNITAGDAATVAAACDEVAWPLDCCTGPGTGPTCTLQAIPIGVLSDGKLYGRGAGVSGVSTETLYVSDDAGQSWTLVSDLSATATWRIERIYDGASDGEVLVVSWNEIMRSTGWPTPSSWSIVLEPTDEIDNSVCVIGNELPCCTGVGTGSCDVPYSVFQVWNSVSTWGDYVTVSEYNAGQNPTHWEESRYAYISTDGGLTFNTFMDVGLQSDPSAGGAAARDPGQKVHIHGTAIDQWEIRNGTPRFWVSHHREGGFPNNANLIYCDDFDPATCSGGKCDCTWNIVDWEPSVAGVQSIQPTTINAAPYGMVLGSDYEPEGHQRILRVADPERMVPEYFTELTWDGASGFTMSTWRDPRNGNVIDVMRNNGVDKPNYVTMSDGRAGNIVATRLPDWTGTDEVGWWGAFITWASGEDWMVIVQADDTSSGTGNRYYLMPAPQRGQDPDYRLNRGNLWPPYGDAADSSVAVGIGADAQLVWSTVVGYRAKADGTALGSVVIGDEATTSSPDTVVIGSKASFPSGLEKSVIIGDAAVGAGTTSVIIGADSTGGSQQGNVAVGQGITLGGTTGNSIAIGRAVDIPDNSFGIAIGSLANTNHATGDMVIVGTNGYSSYRGVAVGQQVYAGVEGTSVGYDAGPTTITATQRQVNIGHTSTSGSNDTVVIGHGANIGTGDTNSIVIGSGASTTNTQSIVIGKSATTDSNLSVIIGDQSTGATGSQVVVGAGSNAGTSDTGAIVIGASSDSNAAHCLAFGMNTACNFVNAVSLGGGSTTGTSVGESNAVGIGSMYKIHVEGSTNDTNDFYLDFPSNPTGGTTRATFRDDVDGIVAVERTACATIESPTTADTAIPMMFFGRASTVTHIGCRVDTGTYTVTVEDQNNTNVDTGTEACVTGTTSITWNTITGGTETFTEGEGIRFDISASTDDAAFATVCFKYTEDN